MSLLSPGAVARIHETVPGNVGPGAPALRRVELLAEDYDRLRTEREEVDRILDRAGIEEGDLPFRVERLRLALREEL